MTRNEFLMKASKAMMESFVDEIDCHGIRGTIKMTDAGIISAFGKLADELGLEEPKTEIVYEWIYKSISGDWHIYSCLVTEDEAASHFTTGTYKKTGRQFEVPCE